MSTCRQDKIEADRRLTDHPKHRQEWGKETENVKHLEERQVGVGGSGAENMQEKLNRKHRESENDGTEANWGSNQTLSNDRLHTQKH